MGWVSMLFLEYSALSHRLSGLRFLKNIPEKLACVEKRSKPPSLIRGFIYLGPEEAGERLIR
jgi:hypothetical protein